MTDFSERENQVGRLKQYFRQLDYWTLNPTDGHPVYTFLNPVKTTEKIIGLENYYEAIENFFTQELGVDLDHKVTDSGPFKNYEALLSEMYVSIVETTGEKGIYDEIKNLFSDKENIQEYIMKVVGRIHSYLLMLNELGINFNTDHVVRDNLDPPPVSRSIEVALIQTIKEMATSMYFNEKQDWEQRDVVDSLKSFKETKRSISMVDFVEKVYRITNSYYDAVSLGNVSKDDKLKFFEANAQDFVLYYQHHHNDDLVGLCLLIQEIARIADSDRNYFLEDDGSPNVLRDKAIYISGSMQKLLQKADKKFTYNDVPISQRIRDSLDSASAMLIAVALDDLSQFCNLLNKAIHDAYVKEHSIDDEQFNAIVHKASGNKISDRSSHSIRKGVLGALKKGSMEQRYNRMVNGLIRENIKPTFMRRWKSLSWKWKLAAGVFITAEVAVAGVVAFLFPASVLVTIPGGYALTSALVASVGGGIAVGGTAGAHIAHIRNTAISEFQIKESASEKAPSDVMIATPGVRGARHSGDNVHGIFYNKSASNTDRCEVDDTFTCKF